MKKLLIIAICVLVVGFAGKAFALSYYASNPVVAWLDGTTTSASFSFNLDTYLFGPGIDINAEDTINSPATLGINFTDDDYGTFFGIPWDWPLEYGNVNAGGIVTGNFEVNPGWATGNVVTALTSTHVLNVTVNRVSGDFGVNGAYLSGDYTDNVPGTPSNGGSPVPEPASLSLLGLGLLGLFRIRRKV